MSQVILLMNKTMCSILIVTVTFFTACKESMKPGKDAENAGDKKTGTVLMVVQADSIFHNHANAGSKKVCCTGPPSRAKIKAEKEGER